MHGHPDRIAGDRRSPKIGNRIRRFVGKNATPVIGALVLSAGGVVVAYFRGIWGLPTRMASVEAQGKANGSAIDSLRSSTNGVVAVLCLKLSDEEFDSAKDLCGEAFRLARVLAKSRNAGLHQ